MVENTNLNDLFKSTFNQVLKGTECVILFDHAWATLHGSGYHSTVYKYSIANGFVPMEFEGRQVNENILLKQICLQATQAHPDDSNFRRISTALEERSSGLIAVHNAHFLSNEATHLIARLVTYIKAKKLDWKIILFAETQSIDKLNLAQLAVEKSFPDSCLDLDWKPHTGVDNKYREEAPSSSGNPIKYALAAILGLSVLLFGLKLIYS